MIKKIKSLVYFELNITLDNKIVLVYTLVFPIIFLLFNRNANITNDSYLYGYWSYIIVTGILSGIVAGTISMRESNFLKMFSYLAKSKGYVFVSNLISQIIVLELELLIFNIFSMLIARNFNIKIIIYCFLSSLIMIPLCGMFVSFFLVMKMRQNTFNVLLNGYLLIMLASFYVKFNTTITWILMAINPFVYFSNMYKLFTFQQVDFINLVVLFFLGIAYSLIGVISIRRMPIIGVTNRY